MDPRQERRSPQRATGLREEGLVLDSTDPQRTGPQPPLLLVSGRLGVRGPSRVTPALWALAPAPLHAEGDPQSRHPRTATPTGPSSMGLGSPLPVCQCACAAQTASTDLADQGMLGAAGSAGARGAFQGHMGLSRIAVETELVCPEAGFRHFSLANVGALWLTAPPAQCAQSCCHGSIQAGDRERPILWKSCSV